MFPTWLHGSGKSMWYAQFIAYIIFPKCSIYLNDLIAENTRTESHSDRNLSTYNNPDFISKFFEDKIKEPRLKNLFNIWFQYSNSKIISNRRYDAKEIQICPYFEKRFLNLIIK